MNLRYSWRRFHTHTNYSSQESMTTTSSQDPGFLSTSDLENARNWTRCWSRLTRNAIRQSKRMCETLSRKGKPSASFRKQRQARARPRHYSRAIWARGRATVYKRLLFSAWTCPTGLKGTAGRGRLHAEHRASQAVHAAWCTASNWVSPMQSAVAASELLRHALQR